jgi:leader peptidase (prepilin peptidase)/N-methyltransferase
VKYWLNGGTAAVMALTTWRLGLDPILPAVLAFIFGGVLLSVIDWRVHRLPTKLVYYTFAGVSAGLVFAALVSRDWLALGTAAVGACLYMSAFFVLYTVSYRFLGVKVIGFGDVRLALVLGALLGWYGLSYLYIGAMLGIVLGGLLGVALVIKHRKIQMTMAFGPPLMLGTLLVILAHA